MIVALSEVTARIDTMHQSVAETLVDLHETLRALTAEDDRLVNELSNIEGIKLDPVELEKRSKDLNLRLQLCRATRAYEKELVEDLERVRKQLLSLSSGNSFLSTKLHLFPRDTPAKT